MVTPPAPARARRLPEVSCLVAAAALLAGAYVVAGLLGGREATAVLTGQRLAGGADEALLGVAFVGLHLLAVIVAPVLALAGLLRAAAARLVDPPPEGPAP